MSAAARRSHGRAIVAVLTNLWLRHNMRLNNGEYLGGHLVCVCLRCGVLLSLHLTPPPTPLFLSLSFSLSPSLDSHNTLSFLLSLSFPLYQSLPHSAFHLSAHRSLHSLRYGQQTLGDVTVLLSVSSRGEWAQPIFCLLAVCWIAAVLPHLSVLALFELLAGFAVDYFSASAFFPYIFSIWGDTHFVCADVLIDPKRLFCAVL